MRREGGSNSVVESQPSKLLVAGSIPVSRSRKSAVGSRQSAVNVVRDGQVKAAALSPRDCELSSLPAAHCQLLTGYRADVAQLAERVLGKDEVTSSILVIGSSLRSRELRRSVSFGSASQMKAVAPKRTARRRTARG